MGVNLIGKIKSIIHYVGSAKVDAAGARNPIFTTGLSPHHKTCFQSVGQLRQGESIVFDMRTLDYERHRYFQTKDLVDANLYNEIKRLPRSQLLDLYAETLRESVLMHLVSDAPLASLFSAGLDSTLITNIAAEQTNISLYHYESELHDLQHYAQDFAASKSLRLHVNKGQDKDYILKLPRMLYHFETINKEEAVVLGELCAAARRDGIKSLLTGDASDEMFAGQSHHADYLTQSRYYNSMIGLKVLRKFAQWFPASPLAFQDADPKGTFYNTFPPWPHLNEIMLNCLLHDGERLADWRECLNAYDFIDETSERETMAYMLDEVEYRLQRFMIRADRFGMMESVELRLPFVYTPLVRLCVNTPLDIRFDMKSFGRGCELKGLLKRLGVHMGLDPNLVYRPKMGTPFNNTPQIQRVLENWSLSRLADTLEVPANQLRDIALNSFDRNKSRVQFGFLAMDILTRLFVDNESVDDLTDAISNAAYA